MLNNNLLISVILKYLLIYNNLFTISVISENVTITIPSLGTFIGKKISNGSNGFLGIKYATVKGRRFKFAEAVVWSNQKEYDATDYGKPCPNWGNNLLSQLRDELDEDCLFLNVYTRNLNSGANQTVIVYIHGGQFQNGVHNVLPLNFLEKDIVFVSVQYRLGPLGFLSTETKDIPGNAGFVDVVFALEWICNYINNFGGNRESVTIFGHDSGAAIASALMYWNRPAIWSDRFKRVILLSGSYFSPWTFDWIPVENAKELTTFLNCNVSQSSKVENLDAVNNCLQEADLKDILKAYQKQIDKNKNLKYSTGCRLTVNDQLPSPYNVLKANERNSPKSLMCGVTKDNGINFLDDAYENFLRDSLANESFSIIDVINSLLRFLGIEDYTGSMFGFITTNLFSYENMQLSNFVKLVPELIDIAGAVTIKAPLLKDIQLSSKSKANSNYLFTYDYTGALSRAIWLNGTIKRSFAAHGDEIRLIFPENISDLDGETKIISQTLTDLITSFAKTGIPKTESLNLFPRATKFSGPYVHIDTVNTVSDDFLREFSVTSRNCVSKLTNTTGYIIIAIIVFVNNFF